MQRKCHGCGAISDVENKPFAACPECGLPYGTRPAATPAPQPVAQQTRQERVAQALRHIDQRPPLPAPPRWFAPSVLTTIFWVYAALLGLSALIHLLIKPSMLAVGGVIISLMLIIATRISIEVVLAVFHIADCSDDTCRSMRILIREEARRQSREIV